MIAAGSYAWFACHELRLSWRDMLSMMTGGRRGQERNVAIGAAIVLVVLHVVAFFALRASSASITDDSATRIAVTAAILLSGSAMLSQAMESVTRTFYSRSDLELILSSPATADRLFAVRIGAVALSVSLMSLFLIGPFIDVLALRGGPRWLAAYGVIIAVSCAATALGVLISASLFQLVGPKSTRLVAQIAAAVIGGLFVVGLQLAALFSTATVSRAAFLRSRIVMTHVPGPESFFWWPARAALGDPSTLAWVLLGGLAAILIVAFIYAPRFAAFAIAAAGVAQHAERRATRASVFRVRPSRAGLRRKEMLLLIRDPWLISQSLMQLLYLLPPAILLWHGTAFGGNAALVVVPVLIMAAGQLAGGLAWLTVSGEDAPDLVHSAPIPERDILRAKIEAVLVSIGIVFAPFVAGLMFWSARLGVIAALGIAASAGSAAAIQFWFRSQAKRSQFRRRHTSSRIATFSEAFSSIGWAAAGAVAAAGSFVAGVIALIPLFVLLGVHRFSPARLGQRAA